MSRMHVFFLIVCSSSQPCQVTKTEITTYNPRVAQTNNLKIWRITRCASEPVWNTKPAAAAL